MAIRYQKLFERLKTDGISKTGLAKALKISSRTMAKLSKNEYVSLQTIEEICRFLKCQPGDMMEFVPNKALSEVLKLLLEEKSAKLKGGLYYWTQVNLAYNSNRIEGSRLSEEQTRFLYETNSFIPEPNEAVRADDITETNNHFKCFDYILEHAAEPLTETMLKQIHYLLKNGTSDSSLDWFAVGDYKRRPNTVGNTDTVPPQKVHGEIVALLDRFNAIPDVTFEDIIAFHYRFESIHPFQDGNGRVGRLIMFKQCLAADIIPFIIDEQKKLFYYRGLQQYQTEPGYLVETCLAAQDLYESHLRYFNTNE